MNNKDNIITYTSWNLKLGENIRRIENQSLITLINPIDKIQNNFKTINEIVNIRDIKCNKGKFIFDALNDVKILNTVNDIFFNDNNSIYLNKNIKYTKKDLLSINKEIYRIVIEIIINKVVRETHVNNILFIHYQIDTEEKFSEKLIKLNDEEGKLVDRINSHLLMIKNIIKERVPNINILEINQGVYLTDSKERSIYLEESIKLKIIEEVKIFIKDNYVFNNEKIHPSLNPIRYCFNKAKIRNKDKLLIVFSAFSQDKPKYNYMNILSYIDCNKLFILDDYGEKGSYYLGLNGELDIETSTMSLISKIMKENNIEFNNVISIGSSKGGSAALYYGLKYNYGNIIVGSPQYKIGSYLSDLSIKTYAREIFGDISLKNRIKYDNLIRLVSNSNSNIFLLTSEGDNQYSKVLKEFENVSDELNIKLHITKCDIEHHKEIAKVFPKFLIDNLSKILKVSNCKGVMITKLVGLAKIFKR